MAFIGAAPVLQTSFSRCQVQRCRWRMVEQVDQQQEKQPQQQEQEQPQRKAKKERRKPPKSNATWANVFLPDFEEKGVGSLPGWDMRPKSQREEKAGVCDYCRGTGVQTCTMCIAGDFIKPTGEVIPCPGCKGKREMTCTTCYGTTEQVELEGNWWERRKGILSLFRKKV